MTFPDFFIVGATKSGTTSLYNYLKIHPDVYMPEQKEIYFFGSDLHYRYEKMKLNVYQSFYDQAAKHQIIGDATAVYLLSKNAAKEIYFYNPQAKIIIVLRNPVDMVYSLHAETVLNGDEPIDNFEEAINLESDRKKGMYLPDYHFCPIECLLYKNSGLYFKQVKRYIDIFGREQILVLFFDDLIRNERLVIDKILNFLCLKKVNNLLIKKDNPSKVIKSNTFRDFLRFLPTPFVTSSRYLLPNKNFRKLLYKKLWDINTEVKERKKLSSALTDKLNAFFHDDLNKLELLLKEPLPKNWKKK